MAGMKPNFPLRRAETQFNVIVVVAPGNRWAGFGYPYSLTGTVDRRQQDVEFVRQILSKSLRDGLGQHFVSFKIEKSISHCLLISWLFTWKVKGKKWLSAFDPFLIESCRYIKNADIAVADRKSKAQIPINQSGTTGSIKENTH